MEFSKGTILKGPAKDTMSLQENESEEEDNQGRVMSQTPKKE